jgi:dolichol-phosphate mannosyltransferase
MKERLVVIPTYNEIENIEAIIRKVFSLPIPFDILIVDDGSPDGTAQKVKELQSEFPGSLQLEERTGKQGLGTAYIHGFKYGLRIGYEYLFEMDADFSHNPDDLMRLYEACAMQNHDMAIGSRYIQGVNVVNWPMSRVLMSYFASKYVQFITGMPICDTTAGFKCYRRRVLEVIDLDNIRFVGYAFQIEMKFTAWKFNFKIMEVPIIFTDRTKGQSKMSKGIFREAVFGVIQMKIGSFFRTYNKPHTQLNFQQMQNTSHEELS